MTLSYRNKIGAQNWRSSAVYADHRVFIATLVDTASSSKQEKPRIGGIGRVKPYLLGRSGDCGKQCQ